MCRSRSGRIIARLVVARTSQLGARSGTVRIVDVGHAAIVDVCGANGSPPVLQSLRECNGNPAHASHPKIADYLHHPIAYKNQWLGAASF